MKKNIAFLIESELEKAEVVLAAKSITAAIQKMAEQAAKMEADDLMPLSDPIREHFGPEIAQSFNDSVAQQLRDLVQKLSEAKNAISDSIARMQGNMPEDNSSDLSTMGADDLGNDAPEGANDLASSGDEEAPDDGAADAEPDNGAASNEEPAAGAQAPTEAPRYTDDEFSGNAAGRARKESVVNRKPMLENADVIVARQYARLINEGKTPSGAARDITGLYGIDIPTLVAIVESAAKKPKK